MQSSADHKSLRSTQKCKQPYYLSCKSPAQSLASGNGIHSPVSSGLEVPLGQAIKKKKEWEGQMRGPNMDFGSL